MKPALTAPTPTDTACITLDLEDNWDFESPDLRYLVFDHLDEYVALLDRLDVPLTVFVVGQVLEDRPEAVRRLDDELDAEFHLHSYQHDMHNEVSLEAEVRKGTRAFEEVLGRDPDGYRAPRFIVNDGDLSTLSDAGFAFDSSICPSYRPGVYNNLDLPTRPYYPAEAPGLLELPVSVHPRLKIPFEQSYLRLFGEPYLRLLERSALPDLLVFNSHLHDYFHTAAHDNLGRIRQFAFKRNIDRSPETFERFVGLLRERGYRFRKLGDVSDEIRTPDSAARAESAPVE
ncbi:polysaccharide deacetylase family protein [Halorussus amylolyticus]|uniref:polysaccharide deacetylase family protein n=1 Tax=Halorussus amylolyticus TaxID=1126242 RepID=UPI0010481EED|nr:polysaccharide deacetylase family protein [Halorussus amylolyticus]